MRNINFIHEFYFPSTFHLDIFKITAIELWKIYFLYDIKLSKQISLLYYYRKKKKKETYNAYKN